ncbi:2-succinyl-5-enolpyruvyl-6-hydroxy-3-cyclohexene-1-carboxylic-acid synthase [Cellulomonas sp. APG4]|uniref:2-succinyl-5-enolpyruvyl-6-hydroxy-3- cyclohexene-1-carboxylic-acid synthase n=1 Tax=Cellulomonas sp. APG4 TaxID=1538656 RepID=UPI0013798083|nr:2-succinyl-5-enolpyruvyl-6-hydroxy-3-cyclohexene-1-carboxylic-acid synthase [Cellulomonas sp. APG4]NCT91638.1 2-succinyl-5-enolpyruvyl-6-hydroxy-3-cyclohexene-1-carboxylic-acid synthase [Cellulomonas sp. APG4]
MSAPAPPPPAVPSPAVPSPAVHAARVLLQALAGLGLRDVVLAPGSRSAPLAYAVAEAAADDRVRDPHAPALRLHVRVDERAAAFLALGLAAAARAEGSSRPVAVVTTSGTAVANLLPATLEARHAGLPLLLLTADRPHELRGTGANQTTDQVGLLPPALRTLDVPAPTGRPGEDRDIRHVGVRAVATALGLRTARPGPVHLNLAFREPLVPDGAPWPARAREGVPVVEPRVPAPPSDPGWSPAPRTLVVAGDGAGPVAREVAEANGWPLVAEPSSGAAGGPRLVRAYRHVLTSPLADAVERVLVLGRPTLDRAVQRLLAREDVETVVVGGPDPEWTDAPRAADRVLAGVPDELRAGLPGTGPEGWAEAWAQAGALASDAVAHVLATTDRLTGPVVARTVARACGRDDVLVVGSSNPVRDLALVAAWDEPPLVHANRGLAGIDGVVSTAVGVGLGLGRPVRALVGDLTFLHDVGGLLVGPLEQRPDLTLVVANDDGGSIFATLEHGQEGGEGVFERVFGTPHGADLAALCAGYGVPHVRVHDEVALEGALRAQVRGVRVVEAVVDRVGRRALDRAVARAVAERLADDSTLRGA